MSAPSAHPLSWPMGKPRTPHHRRRRASFKRNGSYLSIAAGADRVEAEVKRLGGRYLLISSDLLVRLDGRPRSGQPLPADPGVCVYFQIGADPYAMACDQYTTPADNLAAIAAHIEATRAITRYGVATAAETLQAFLALPDPKASVVRQWWEVLGVDPRPAPSEVDAAYRKLAAERHPDRGGTDQQMAELNAARDAARKALV